MVLTQVRPVLRNGFGMPEQGKYGRINPIALCRYIAKRLWRLLRLGIQREVPPLREAAHVLYSSHEAFAGVLTHSWSLGEMFDRTWGNEWHKTETVAGMERPRIRRSRTLFVSASRAAI